MVNEPIRRGRTTGTVADRDATAAAGARAGEAVLQRYNLSRFQDDWERLAKDPTSRTNPYRGG
ncbi:hypothetical protein ABZV93_08745 [Actinopolymorpha sp. NPDC004070]|uniref:hypothetical protein n=1 Tax=Actinopolymorpha sp. NPDC004070 TaxID=3154548 RepID=UPI0033A0644A